MKKKSPGKWTPILVIGFLLSATGLALVLVKQQQDIRQRAQSSDSALVCQPEGGMVNKLNSNTLIINNGKSNSVNIWIQENLCDYDGNQPQEGYQCNTFLRRYPDTVPAGESRTYSVSVPKCKVGQIDINTDLGDTSGCYTPNGDQWSGGLAYAIKANSQGYPNDCNPPPTPTGTPRPTSTPRPTRTRTPTPVPSSTPSVCPVPQKVENVTIECPFCAQ